MGTKDPAAAAAELAATLGLLIRRLKAAVPSDEQGLSWTQMAVLSRLSKDGPMTTADLARAEGMKPQSMGSVVTGLEELKLIERRAHPTDGRQMNLHTTARGEAIRKSAREARRTWLAQAIGRLDRADQATLLAAGEILQRLAES